MSGYWVGIQKDPEIIRVPSTIIKDCKVKEIDCIPEEVYSKLINECSKMGIKCANTVEKNERELRDCLDDVQKLNKDLDEYRYL